MASEAKITLTRATEADFPEIWPILSHVAQHEDSHGYAQDLSYEAGLDDWFRVPKQVTYIARIGAVCVGTYVLRPNFKKRGGQIVNGSYMVHPEHRGKGVGRAMGLHSFEAAKSLGYEAMQYNCVVSTNTGAVRLWLSLGFKVIGTVPRAYQHRTKGLVDAYIMHRFL